MNIISGISEPLRQYITNFLQSNDPNAMMTKDNSNYIINIIIIGVGLYFLFYTIDAFFKVQYIVIFAIILAYYLRKKDIYFYKK